MNTNKKNFELWFCEILKPLYGNVNAGFPVLMITLPLLERYLRLESGTNEGDLKDRFYESLRKLFPVLKDNVVARKFWDVYRNELLHQATLPRQERNGIRVQAGWLSDKGKDLEIDENNDFWVNPVKFSERVIGVIDKDFQTYEANGLSGLAEVRTTPDGFNSTCGEYKREYHLKKISK